MRIKLLPSMSLVAALSVTTLAGCDSDPGAEIAQRDVYSGPNAFQDCVADWGNPDLCRQQLDEAEKKALAQSGSSGGGGGGPGAIFIWGPSYMGYDRSASYNGVRYTPKETRAYRSAFSSRGIGKPNTFSAPRPSTYGVSSRGGFGSSGRSTFSSSGRSSFGG